MTKNERTSKRVARVASRWARWSLEEFQAAVHADPAAVFEEGQTIAGSAMTQARDKMNGPPKNWRKVVNRKGGLFRVRAGAFDRVLAGPISVSEVDSKSTRKRVAGPARIRSKRPSIDRQRVLRHGP